MLLATCEAGSDVADSTQRKIMKSILDPTFRYTKSVDTDLKKTFARIRRMQRKQGDLQAAQNTEVTRKVVPLHGQRH
jgi:hypothetical protein